MPEVVSLDRILNIGVEATSGTTVTPTKQLVTYQFMPQIQASASLFMGQGQKYNTVAQLNQEWTAGTWTSDPSYGEIIYALSSLFGAATITTPVGGTVSRQWQWIEQANVFDTPKTYTIVTGDTVRAEQFGFGTFTAGTFRFSRTQVQATGSIMGQQTTDNASYTPLVGQNDVQTVSISGAPTGGTFTLTFNAQTTAAIAYNATAAAVQAALVLLSNIGAGGVTCTGGPLPATPVVVTFTGNLGNQPQNVMTHTDSFTGGTSPAAAVAHTTTGVAITAEPVAQIIQPNSVSLYLDTNSGSLGSTQELRTFNCEIAWPNKYLPVWVLNGSLPSFAALVEGPSQATVKGTMASDTQGASLITGIRAGTRYYMRLQATGPVIEAAISFQLTFDLAVNFTQLGPTKNTGGIYTRDFTATIMHDPGWGRAATVTVVNKQTAL